MLILLIISTFTTMLKNDEGKNSISFKKNDPPYTSGCMICASPNEVIKGILCDVHNDDEHVKLFSHDLFSLRNTKRLLYPLLLNKQINMHSMKNKLIKLFLNIRCIAVSLIYKYNEQIVNMRSAPLDSDDIISVDKKKYIMETFLANRNGPSSLYIFNKCHIFPNTIMHMIGSFLIDLPRCDDLEQMASMIKLVGNTFMCKQNIPYIKLEHNFFDECYNFLMVIPFFHKYRNNGEDILYTLWTRIITNGELYSLVDTEYNYHYYHSRMLARNNIFDFSIFNLQIINNNKKMF